MTETENTVTSSSVQKVAEQKPEKINAKKTKPPCVIKVGVEDGKYENKQIAMGHGLPKDTCGYLADDFVPLLGTKNIELADEIISRGVNAMPDGRGTTHNINIQLQALHDMEPKDTIEARLITQISALSAQGMEYLCKTEGCDWLTHRDFYIKSAIKLLRLQNETIDTLMRYRRGGEQKVTVQHQYVNVNDGGQAVVAGTIEPLPRGGK